MGSIRTLLAITVIFGHTSGAAFVGSRNAVQMFYIISGFLISYVLTEVRSYNTVGAFYVNRYLRLFPVYAVVAILTLLAYTLGGEPDFFRTYSDSPPSARIILVFANATLLLQDWVMFLGVRLGHLRLVKDFYVSDPQLYKGLLAWQAWSLGVELTFYLVAPFLLKNQRFIWLVLTTSIAIRILFVSLGFGTIDPWTYRFFPTELAFFLCGSLSHQLLLKRYRALSRERLSSVAKWATFGMLVLSASYQWIPTPEIVRMLVLFGAFFLLAPALFEFQRTTAWDNAIGKLSYPIYICHMLVRWVVLELFGHFGWTNSLASTTVIVIASIGFAWLLDVAVSERVELFRRRVRDRSVAAQRAAAG